MAPTLHILRKAILYFLIGDKRRWRNYARAVLRDLRDAARERIRRRFLVNCDCCGWSGKRFRTFVGRGGRFLRNEVRCPRCGSLEEQRMIIRGLKPDVARLCGQARFISFGRDRGLARGIRRLLGVDCFHVDLVPAEGIACMDVSRLAFPERTFDGVIVNHVLERVLDDRRAMRQISRVLKHDGRAIFIVAVEKRRRHTVEYGGPDPEECGHVRRYGRDLLERLAEEGLQVRGLDGWEPGEWILWTQVLTRAPEPVKEKEAELELA